MRIAASVADLLDMPARPRRPGFQEDQAIPSPLPDLENAVSGGLPTTALFNVALRIAGNAEQASIIERRIIPKSTLARRAGSGTLTREESEKTERLARLFAQATESLGSEDEARLFLRRPHPELDGRVPLEAAITELGGRRVERILTALAYGLSV